MYVKNGRSQTKPAKRIKAKATVNKEKTRLREAAARQRRFMQSFTSLTADNPRQQDHLPGSAEDRFAQVYRKGGVRDGVDSPDDSRFGRGYASPENR